jgi:hypothetical protein
MGVGVTRSARNQGLMRNLSQQLASWRGSTKHCDSRFTARKARAAARAMNQLHPKCYQNPRWKILSGAAGCPRRLCISRRNEDRGRRWWSRR